MEDSANPFDQLVSWIFAQPREVREEIAYSILNFVPGLEEPFPDMDVDTLPDKLQAWFEKQVEHSIVARTSTILFVRSVTDYFVMRHKGSKEHWLESQQWNQQVSVEIQQTGLPTDVIDGVVQSMPFRQRLWSRSFNTWCDFRDNQISDDALERWFNADRGA